MAKHQNPKASTTGRNGDRPNGKAWGRHHREAHDTVGHNGAGRTKPSGATIAGHDTDKLMARYGHTSRTLRTSEIVHELRAGRAYSVRKAGKRTGSPSGKPAYKVVAPRADLPASLYR